MIVHFTFVEMPHPNAEGLTIFELAQILEGKYHICEHFTDMIQEKLLQQVGKMLNRSVSIHAQALQEWLKNEWREYIISGKAGFTAASAARGDPAFVETSAYYLSMQPELEFTAEEKKFVV